MQSNPESTRHRVGEESSKVSSHSGGLARRRPRATAAFLILIVSTAAALAHGVVTRTAANPPGAPADHFLCYDAKDAKLPPFVPM